MGLSSASPRHHGYGVCENGIHCDAHLPSLSNAADTAVAASWILHLATAFELHHGVRSPAPMSAHIWSLGSHDRCRMLTALCTRAHRVLSWQSVASTLYKWGDSLLTTFSCRLVCGPCAGHFPGHRHMEDEYEAIGQSIAVRYDGPGSVVSFRSRSMFKNRLMWLPVPSLLLSSKQ